MARIPMTGGFAPLPEGTYVFRIESAEYDEEFGKIVVKMVTSKGRKQTERFSIKNQDDTYNEKAMGAFSYFAKTAMNDFDMEDIDPEELVGHYLRAEVVHTKVPSNREPGKMTTFVNLGDKEPADGFDDEPVTAAPVAKEEPTKGLDLDSLLG